MRVKFPDDSAPSLSNTILNPGTQLNPLRKWNDFDITLILTVTSLPQSAPYCISALNRVASDDNILVTRLISIAN